jgi:hypothetical protein
MPVHMKLYPDVPRRRAATIALDTATAGAVAGLILTRRLVPAVLLLVQVLPQRVAQVRRMAVAEQVLSGADPRHRNRLLAQRAAFGLAYDQLTRHSADPLGDLHQGRLDGLIAALFEDAGLRPPG